jgi:hypothetical protein
MRKPVTNRRKFMKALGPASILVGSGVPLRNLAAEAEP